jgi:hypothetical protein
MGNIENHSMQESFLVMLPKPEIGFYFQLESDEPVYQLTCFNQFSQVDFELVAMDSNFQNSIQLNETNYQFNSFKELFKQVEERISQMILSQFHLTFENKHKLIFDNGELSSRFDSQDFLQLFAEELLTILGFDGRALYQKLTQHTNCYLEIDIENPDYFEPIGLAE